MCLSYAFTVISLRDYLLVFEHLFVRPSCGLFSLPSIFLRYIFLKNDRSLILLIPCILDSLPSMSSRPNLPPYLNHPVLPAVHLLRITPVPLRLKTFPTTKLPPDSSFQLYPCLQPLLWSLIPTFSMPTQQ